MKNKIKQYVAIHFSDIPYSGNAAQAQNRIVSALNDEYETLCSNDDTQHSALETLIQKYAKLSDMAKLAGYTESEVADWRSVGEIISIEETKKILFSQRRIAYFIAFATSLFAVNLFEGIFLHWANLLFSLVWGIAAFFGLKAYRIKRNTSQGLKCNRETYQFLCTLSDRYTKRTINSICLLFSLSSLFAPMLLAVVFGNMKFAEFLTLFVSNIAGISIPLILCVKNLLCLDAVKRKLSINEDKTLRKHLVGILIFSVVYLVVALVLTVVLSGIVNYPVNVYVYAFLVYMIAIAVYNLTLRKRITFTNIVINKKRIAVITIVSIVFSGYSDMQEDTWYTQPYINSISRIETADNKISYNEENGVYTVTAENDDFKILQITDVHLGGSGFSYTKDIKALEATYALIEHTHPDLVIVTGDLTFPMGLMSLSLNNSAPVNQFAAFMRNIDIPWAFTYGNHDTESVATLSRTELNEVYESLSYKTSGTLLYPYVQPDITGRSNQLIEIRNSDGSLNQALFLIDSNDYTGEGLNVYDYIHDDQVDWYADEVKRLNAQEGKDISSMVFFHIPLQQYRTAYELYLQGSDEVKYFFGENNEK